MFELKYRVYPKNTIIFPKIGAAISTNKKRILAQPAVFDNNVMGIIPSKKLDYKFLYYLMTTFDLSFWASESSPPSIRKSIVESTEIPLPPISVQEKIVAEIDSYQKIIDGARQVVESYQPRIKIEKEWEVVKIGEICEINPKKQEVAKLEKDMEVSFVPMSDLLQKQMTFKAKESRKLGEVINSYTYFRNQDVLLAKITPCFENGKSGIASNLINGVGFGSTEFIVIRPTTRVLPEWIYYFISDEEFIKNGKLFMTGSAGQQRLSIGYVTDYVIPFPPIDVQEQIVTKIKEEQKLIDACRRLIEIYIDKIKNKISEIWGK